MKILLLTLVLTGCVTPNKWGSDAHQNMMYACQTMCTEGSVKRYSPLTGACECHKPTGEFE